MTYGIKCSFMICFAMWVLLTPTTFEVTGNVQIKPPYYPALFVKTEETFNITCLGKNVKLFWSRTTNSGKENIQAISGSEYELTLIEHQPSGDVRSILVKKDAKLADSGTYTCSNEDGSETFDVAIIVVYIWTEFQNKQILDMSCAVAGFSRNLPEISHTWSHNGSTIPPDTAYYNITGNGEHMSIQKSYPVQEDSGYYECVFTFKTNVKTISVSERMYYIGSHLPSARGTAASNTSWLWMITIAIYRVIVIH